MKKAVSLSLICSLLVFFAGFVPRAEAQTETIATIDAAKELAQNAGGVFVEGEKVPALTGNQVALPVIEEESGKILGHIVAERNSLVSALNAAGHTEVASAIAAGEAGAAAGTTVGAGIIGGTTGMTALGVAAVAGVALAVSGGGGDSTSGHSTTSNH
ncbi:MAG: hypothetical protein GXP46_12590 [Deferribacteres bacterium]|nr:hypothetical protein [Deferribacteres bacterium]